MFALHVTQNQMALKIMEGQKDRVSYYAAIVNADLSRITELLQRMCVDDDVAMFLQKRDSHFDYQDYEAYLDSYEKLKSYQATSIYIDDVFLVIPQTKELLRANLGVTTIPEEYEASIEECLTGEDEVFFSIGDNMIYLSRGISGTVVGVEVSVRHIKTMLNALNPGYFDCFLVNRDTGELLGNNQVTESARLVYQEIRERQEEGKDDSKQYTVTVKQGGSWLYDCVETPGNYFLLYLFAEEEKVYADLYLVKKIWMVFTVLMFAVPVLVGYLFHRTLSRPMKSLVTAMQAVENQNWNYRLEENESTDFNYVFHQYNHMASEIEILIQQVYEKQLQVEQAKRRQLQAQINPHFLFNSFYMGYRMAKNGESEKVANLCMYLGDYFKVLTYESDTFISLEQEMRFIETYLRLNRMRFEEKLEYEIHMKDSVKESRIMPLLLQPLVENSIRHGVERVQKPCRIVVEAVETDGMLQCSVTDNCGTADEDICERLQKIIHVPELPTEHFGLWNIQNRLLSLGGTGSGLHFDKREDGSFCVFFLIPLNLQ
jgi:sensor histidine kinase YesM